MCRCDMTKGKIEQQQHFPLGKREYLRWTLGITFLSGRGKHQDNMEADGDKIQE